MLYWSRLQWETQLCVNITVHHVWLIFVYHSMLITVHHKKDPHCLCTVVLFVLVLFDFTHVLHSCYTATGQTYTSKVTLKNMDKQITSESSTKSFWYKQISIFNRLPYTASQITMFMGPAWVLSAPCGPHVGPKNLAIRDLSHLLYAVTSGIINPTGSTLTLYCNQSHLSERWSFASCW